MNSNLLSPWAFGSISVQWWLFQLQPTTSFALACTGPILLSTDSNSGQHLCHILASATSPLEPFLIRRIWMTMTTSEHFHQCFFHEFFLWTSMFSGGANLSLRVLNSGLSSHTIHIHNLSSVSVFIGVLCLCVWLCCNHQSQFSPLWLELLSSLFHVAEHPWCWIVHHFVLFLGLNLLGLIPHCGCVTCHLSLNGFVSLSFLHGLTIGGFQIHGLHFLSFLLPNGAPMTLVPWLVVIELISYGFRAASLGLRLFANLMAGHCLLHILSCFGSCFHLIPDYSIGNQLHTISCSTWCATIAISMALQLEWCVAMIQAYVFCTLLCVYLRESIAHIIFLLCSCESC